MTPTQTTDRLGEKLKALGLELMDIGHEVQMCGAVYSGKGRVIVIPFPDEHMTGWTPDTSYMELSPDDWAAFLNQSDTLNTPVGKAILRKCQRQIDQIVAWNVFKRDSYECRYCGRRGLPLTVDHVELWEDGGPTIEDNLISACRRCNKTRGRMKYEDWLESPEYNQCSRYLDHAIDQQNQDVLSKLAQLRAKRVNVRSR